MSFWLILLKCDCDENSRFEMFTYHFLCGNDSNKFIIYNFMPDYDFLFFFFKSGSFLKVIKTIINFYMSNPTVQLWNLVDSPNEKNLIQ